MVSETGESFFTQIVNQPGKSGLVNRGLMILGQKTEVMERFYEGVIENV